MILNLNNNNSTERSKPEIARRDSVEVKAFVAHAERVMQWGGIEYNLNRLYKTVLDLAEQAEDSGIKEDYTFCLSIQRIDLGKSYIGSGAGLNGLLNVFCEANVYLSEQLAIMTGGNIRWKNSEVELLMLPTNSATDISGKRYMHLPSYVKTWRCNQYQERLRQLAKRLSFNTQRWRGMDFRNGATRLSNQHVEYIWQSC